MIIGQQSEPVVLVGHSYGGAVITEAGNHPKVAALVYVAAFAPDQGESVETLLGTFPPGEPNAGDAILPPQDGFLFLDREKFHESVRGRLECRRGSVHGRLAGPMGRRSPERHDRRGGMAEQAELVPRRHRRPDDPPADPALDVRAGGFDRRGGRGQPRDLRVAAGAVAALIEKAASEVSSAAR